MKTNLFSRFRNLFRREEPEYDYEDYDAYDESYADSSDGYVQEEHGDDLERVNVSSGEVDPGTSYDSAAEDASVYSEAPQADHGPQGETDEDSAGAWIEVPLKPIVSGLSLELQPMVLNEVGNTTILLSVERLLPQLAGGAVNLTLGELREAAPNVFGGGRQHDAALVDIPLSVIIPHLSPNVLARRQGLQAVDIPDEIVSPFADKGRGLCIGSTQARSQSAPPPAPAVPSKPASAPVEPKPVPFQAPKPAPVASAPVPPSKPERLSRPIPVPFASAQGQPEASGPARREVGTTHLPRPATPPAPRTVRAPSSPVGYETPRPGEPVDDTTRLFKLPKTPEKSVPAANTPATRPEKSTATQIVQRPGVPAPAPGTSGPSMAAPQPTTPPVPVPVGATEVSGAPGQPPLEVPLSSVASGWSEALKTEIVHLKLTDAVLNLPHQVVEAGLKRGKLTYPWKTVRGWLKPAAGVAASPNDALEVELPLRVIAPLFVSRKRSDTERHKKVSVDKDIPNLFFGLPQPDTAGVAVDHSVNRPVDTNYYVWDDRDESVSDDGTAYTPSHSAGTEFVSRYATPNEVVSRAAGMEGVVGAVIALPDGLMVASELPAELNGDTLAAFLPHLFGKVSQCTQELRMGEVNNLNFTVGNVPWKIWRVNSLYFAAFGQKGQPLPTASLSALAAELDHKAKA